jgi:8-oxo-dGTP diphosphatase
MDEAALRTQFPGLFTPVHWGPVEAVFIPSRTFPHRSLIGNVNIIPFVGINAVVLRVADGRPEIPGGTLEPGEDYLSALRRELIEEAGARLQSFTLLGAWRCRTSAGEPYRPHLPFPDFYRVGGYGDVALDGPPTNPDGGEQIAEVAVVSVDEASALFRRWQRPDIAALYDLAHLSRLHASFT